MGILFIFVFGIITDMSGAAIHTLQYFYTATSGIPNFPEFVSLGMVDGQQVDYYDSKIKRTIPKTEWMKAAEGPEYWDQETQICLGSESVYKNNINVVKFRFNQSAGVHTNQVMYGCEWDDETGATDGFHMEGYDGEDFLTLDLKNLRWISPKQQGFSTQQKLNNDRAQLEHFKQYFGTTCIDWLKKYVHYGKNKPEKIVSPQVSLLQKDSSSPLACHATGFYPSGVKITWMRNGQEHEEDVNLGQLLPNEDGTFQRTSFLTVKPDELKQYSCVVEHQGKTITTITEKEIRTNNADSVLIAIIVGVIAAVVQLVVTCVVGYKVYQKKGKSVFVQANTSDSSSDDCIKSHKPPVSCPGTDPGYGSGSERNSDSGSDTGSDVCSDSGSDHSSADSTDCLIKQGK